MSKIVVITGTPGVGKTFLANKIAANLKGSVVIRANEVVEKQHIYGRRDRYGTRVVDLSKLKKALDKEISRNKNATYVILEGHLLSDMGIKNAIAIILRIHLEELKLRLIKRGYATEKIRDNIVSEAIDYCGSAAARNYARAYEFMSTDRDVEKRIIAAVRGKPSTAGKSIDLLGELATIIRKEKKYAL